MIAVSISNYKENKENESYIEKTLLTIENEIKLSKTEIDTVLNRHILLFEMLENKLDDKEETLIKLISSAGGF